MPLPPGSLGLPVIGETPAFLSNMYRFLDVRQKRYGNIFKSNVLGRRIVFLSGMPGAEAFYNSDNISRADAHPFPLVDLFGGVNMEMYDGPRHAALKAMALTAFDHTALAGYLPDMQRLIESTLTRLSTVDEFSAIFELRLLSIEAMCCNVMGIEPGLDTEAITRDYGLVVTGLTSIPVSFPGTPYAKARAARDRLLARLRGVIAERRARPTSDGLSRILTARADDGRVYTDEEAMLEVHHMVIAGFIVYALMAEAIRQLALQPELRARCVDEVRTHASSGPLSMPQLAKLRTVTSVILESKRWLPLVPLAFGRAQRDFTCGGFDVPAGWTVYLALSLLNRDTTSFAEPDRFDADRFGPERAEHKKHPMAFIPQGAEPPTGHRCLGLDYATVLGVAFVALLLRNYEWTLPEQDLSWNWKTLPPEPRDRLRVQMRRVAG